MLCSSSGAFTIITYWQQWSTQVPCSCLVLPWQILHQHKTLSCDLLELSIDDDDTNCDDALFFDGGGEGNVMGGGTKIVLKWGDRGLYSDDDDDDKDISSLHK